MSKSYIPVGIRRTVLELSKGYCEYCLLPSDYFSTSYTIDHILPESLQGKTVSDNLAYACGSCNRNKYDKITHLDNVTGQMTRLYNPRQDDWTTHFRWNTDETQLLGITAIGRVTVELLKLNRNSNINQRTLLRLVGLHPPNDYP